MLTDLRKINAVIQPMGPLQPGLPQPSMIPLDWNIKVIDLKDCFFTILITQKLIKKAKQGKTTKMVQTSYHLVQKAELYAVILLLQDFASPLNINTDSQYVEYTVKHIYFVTLFDDGTELYELFHTLQQLLYDRHHDLCITHIRHIPPSLDQ